MIKVLNQKLPPVKVEYVTGDKLRISQELATGYTAEIEVDQLAIQEFVDAVRAESPGRAALPNATNRDGYGRNTRVGRL